MNILWLFSCLVLLQLISIPQKADSAKILIFHNVASYSHRVVTWPLAEALTNLGHQITYISPFPPKHPNPNITEFVPETMANFVENYNGKEFNVELRVSKSQPRLINNIFDYAYGSCEALLVSNEFDKWLSENPKFDLVISDNCFSHECGVGLAYKLNAKYIYFGTVVAVPYEYDLLGYQPETSVVPLLEVDPPKRPMGFFTRVSNALMSIRWRAVHMFHSIKIDNLIRTALKVPEMPFIGDLIDKASLVFYTGDVISDFPRTLPPNYVNIAGIHCKESTNALPEDIANFIKAGNETGSDDEGFIYLSLGTAAISSDLPDRIKQVFFKTIESFPNLKFLWKWNGDFPKDIPGNLMLRKWFPQMDVLSNPKIRAFITQQGRPSTLEAIFNGVPMISFPVLGDQDYNANRLAEMGASIKLEIGAVTLEEFKEAIRKTVYDPKVKARMTKYQNIFRDRPMSPLDTAVWWTEYVLRTEDTSHLRPAGVDQNWLVRRQIDVWAFLSISLFVISVLFLITIVKIANRVFKSQPKIKRS